MATTPSLIANPDLNEVEVHDKYGRPILTVGVLRSLMEGINDDVHVAFDDCDGWYRNISVVALPDDPEGEAIEGYSALTFLAGEPLDPRQF